MRKKRDRGLCVGVGTYRVKNWIVISLLLPDHLFKGETLNIEFVVNPTYKVKADESVNETIDEADDAAHIANNKSWIYVGEHM